MMKRYYGFVIGVLVMQNSVVETRNYLHSAHQQVVSRSKAIQHQAQKVKAQTENLLKSIHCVQNKLGCSPLQIKTIDDVLLSIDAALVPLLNIPLHMAASLQKPLHFINNKVAALQSSLRQLTTLTPQQKALLVSHAKKIAIAGAALVAAAAIIAVSSVVAQGKSIPQIIEEEGIKKGSDDYNFVEAVVKQHMQEVATYLKDDEKLTIQGLKAAEKIVMRDTSSQGRSLLGKIRLAINAKEVGGLDLEGIRIIKQYQLEPGSPDYRFINLIMKKNITLIENWLAMDMPTLTGLKLAYQMILNDKQYPQRNELLGQIGDKIHEKESPRVHAQGS